MTRIDGRFALEAEIGRGGMGVVHRALDEASGERVALKLLTPGSTGVDRRRFAREAQVLAGLSHPHVVGYVAHSAGPQPYLAMRWLEGETLGARLARDGSLDVRSALTVARATAAGLGAAHAIGVVHRDVKPDNLFLVDGDPARLVVIDFGIARALSGGHTLTRAGAVVGTPFYMAPEQARADAPVDARTDVYALGAVLYHALCGQPPFRSDNLMAVLAAILMDPPRDVRDRRPGLPDAVGALVMRCLAKEPGARAADGRALSEALRALGDSAERGAPSLRPPALTEREQRVLCLVLAAAPLVSVGGATLAPGESDRAGRLRATAEANGGHVAVLADGSMIVRIDDAEEASEQAVAAARCALAMQRVEPTLALAAVAGRGHFQGPMPVGEVVERGAALLSSSAEAGAGERRRPRVNEDLAALLRGRAPVGRDATGLVLSAASGGAADQGRRFVGRARELASLGALLDEAFDEPLARAAVIGGAAGMGKTRLLAEVLDVARERARVFEARADPIASGAPFAVVAQLVRAAAGITEGDPLTRRRDALYTLAVSALEAGADRPAADAVEQLAMHLGELARVPMAEPGASIRLDEPTLRGDAMREAWLRWLTALLGQRPLVLALDDLQWADTPSLSMIDAALRELADRPLLVLAAGRDELESRFGELWAEHEAQPMRLARLRKSASRALVRASLPDASEAIVERVLARGDGNPLFLEELASAVAGGAAEDTMPTTVLGVVEARLATLAGPTRRLLRAGSVFGPRFWSGGVRELLGGPRAPEVDGPLEALVERALLEPSAASRFPTEPEWSFRQALTRDASYAALTDEDRELGHRLAAGWLERAGVTDAAVLAEHHERGKDPSGAARHHARAAEQLLESDDLEGAIRSGERALRASDEAAQPGVRLTLASAYRWRAEYGEALTHAVAAAASLPPGTRARYRAMGVVFASARPARDPDAARRWLEIAREPADDDAQGARVVALCRAAAFSLAEGDDDGVARSIDAARAGFGACPADDLARAWLRTIEASRALRDGDLGEFADGTAEAAEAYSRAGDERDACNQRVRLGNALVGLGEPERAREVLEIALASARRMGLRLVEGYALQNLGHAILRAQLLARLAAHEAGPTPRGRTPQETGLEAVRSVAEGSTLEEAASAERRAIQIAQTLGDEVMEAGSRIYLSEILGHTDPDAALQEATRAAELVADVPGFRVVARARLAVCHMRDPEEFLRLAESAYQALESEPIDEGEPDVWATLALARSASGDIEGGLEIRARGAAQLRARAARISDPKWRRSYLERVLIHRWFGA